MELIIDVTNLSGDAKHKLKDAILKALDDNILDLTEALPVFADAGSAKDDFERWLKAAKDQRLSVIGQCREGNF